MAANRLPSGGVLLVLLALLVVVPTARALITFNLGNDPVKDGGWPEGALEVANLESRVVTWDGPLSDGSGKFAYRGDTGAFQQALDAFAKIDAPERVLVVHGGTAELSFLKDEKDPKSTGRYDWRFTVYNEKEFTRLRDDPGSRLARTEDAAGKAKRNVPPPQIDLYVGGGGGVVLSLVRVPDGVTLVDERASASGYPPEAGSVLRGRVRDLDGGKPLAGARVALRRYAREQQRYEEVAAATAGADGRFEVTKVPPGDYDVTAAADGYAPRSLGHAAVGADTLKEYPAAKLARAARLAGRVTGPGGKPLPDVTVRADGVRSADGTGYAHPDGVKATTDASGHFTLDGLPPGKCQLDAQAKGLHQADPFKGYAIPTGGVVLKMGATGTVRGKLTQAGGAPTGGTYLAELTPEGGHRVGSYGGSAEVKADGTFEFTAPPGKYTVTARLNPGPEVQGKDPNARDIEVKPGETVAVEIEVK